MNNNHNKYKRLFSDTLAFTISNFASKILVFMLIPLYTSILSTEEYGIADLLTNTINVLYPIVTLSIMEATLRFAFEKEVSKDAVLVNSLFVIGISELIIVLLYPVVQIFNQSVSRYWVWVAVMYFGFNFQQIMSQYAKGIGKTKIFAFSGVIHTVVILLTNIIGLVVLKLGLTAYLASIVFGYYITAIFLWWKLKIKIKFWKIDFALLKDMIKFSLPMAPTIVAWWVSTSADKYIIIGYFGVALSGIYSVAYKIPSILTLFTNIFSSAWTISVIENVNEKDSDKYQSTVYNIFNVFNVLACSVLILFSQLLGRILFANEFYAAWTCVPMLLVAYVFSGLAGFMASSFRAVKYTKGLLSSTLIGAITNIVLNFLFIKHYGMMGAAFTTMLGFAVTFYIRSQKLKRVINIQINLKRDTLVYSLLVIQAYVIGHTVKFSYFIGVMLLLVILFIYKEEYTSIVSRILLIIRKKIISKI